MAQWFDTGWLHGLCGLWLPPKTAGMDAKRAYKDGWRLGRDELLLNAVRK